MLSDSELQGTAKSTYPGCCVAACLVPVVDCKLSTACVVQFKLAEEYSKNPIKLKQEGENNWSM